MACDDPEDAEALAGRLGRYADTGRPTLGGVPLADLPVAVVRERILLAGNADRMFAGTLRQSLSGVTNAPDEVLTTALYAASGEDVIDALDEGLDTEVEEKGRNFSGGQLQRLRLARALVADPEILLAVEVTSAVDAHTEARIAERIGPYRAARPGTRTTVLFTTSPLVLDHADAVAYVEGGRVVALGTHGELLDAQPGYEALVTRARGRERGRPPRRAREARVREKALIAGGEGTRQGALVGVAAVRVKPSRSVEVRTRKKEKVR